MEKQQKDRIILVCPVCGKEFKAHPSEIRRKRKYCSLGCYWKVQPNRKLEQKGLEKTLREFYIKKKLTTIEIAKKFKCDPKTVTYWMDKFSISRRTFSEIMKISNPAKRPDVRKKMSEKAKLRGQRPEERERRSEVAKRLWADPKFRKKKIKQLKESSRGKNNPNYGNRYSFTEETKEHLREIFKKKWKNPLYARKVITALQEKPNKFERKLIRLIKRNGFPFRYVGDGQVVIDGQVPDFIATDGTKKVIELFGAPWHDPNHSKKIKVKPNRTEESKHKFYESRGYELLVIWDDELKNEAKVVEKISCLKTRS